MAENSHSAKMEELITRDEKLAFTMISYLAILIILLNLTFTNFLPIGVIATIVYLIVNGTFLGNAFFGEERFILKFLLGNLLLLVFLGLVSWVVIIVSNLGVANSTIVLFVVATIASLSGKLRTRFWR